MKNAAVQCLKPKTDIIKLLLCNIKNESKKVWLSESRQIISCSRLAHKAYFKLNKQKKIKIRLYLHHIYIFSEFSLSELFIFIKPFFFDKIFSNVRSPSFLQTTLVSCPYVFCVLFFLSFVAHNSFCSSLVSSVSLYCVLHFFFLTSCSLCLFRAPILSQSV